ncbi:MAG: hypothetical protein HYY30_01055 [Chloroflexi bacterium]|nr:hypothetical protein [Chloroflexota bacterium]
MTDYSGQVIFSYTYDAFGGLKSITGTLANEFRFTGEQFDADAGLYYFRARHYDPSTGILPCTRT